MTFEAKNSQKIKIFYDYDPKVGHNNNNINSSFVNEHKRSLSAPSSPRSPKRELSLQFHGLGLGWLTDAGLKKKDINEFPKEDLCALKTLIDRVQETLKSNALLTFRDEQSFNIFELFLQKSFVNSEEKVLFYHKMFSKLFAGDLLPQLNKKGQVFVSYDQFVFLSQIIKNFFPAYDSLVRSKGDVERVMEFLQKIALGGAFLSEEDEVKFGLSLLECNGYVRPIVPQLGEATPLMQSLNSKKKIFQAVQEGYEIFIKYFIEGAGVITCNSKEVWGSSNNRTVEAFLEIQKQCIKEALISYKKNINFKLGKELKLFFLAIEDVFGRQENFKKDGREKWLAMMQIAFSQLPDECFKNLQNKEIFKNNHFQLTADQFEILCQAKWLEFLLFLSNDYQKAAETVFGSFYKDYNQNNFSYLSLPCHLDVNLEWKPKTISINYQMLEEQYTKGCIIDNPLLSCLTPLAQITSEIDFIANKSPLFFLQNPVGLKQDVIKHVGWSWKASPRTIKWLISQLDESVVISTLDLKRKQFHQQLKTMGQLTKGDDFIVEDSGEIIIETKSVFGTWFSNKKGVQLEVEKEKAEQISQLLTNGFNCYEKYIDRSLALGVEDSVLELESLKLRTSLECAKKGLNHYLDHLKANEALFACFLYESIQLIDKVLTTLPIVEEEGHQFEVGLFKKIRDALLESDKEEDYQWKIIRYQAALVQLKQFLVTLLYEEFDPSQELNIEEILNQIEEDGWQGEFKNLAIELIDHLEINQEVNQQYLKTLRDQYANKFFDQLESCLTKKNKENVENEIEQKLERVILKLSHFFFTKINLEPVYNSLNDDFFEIGKALISHQEEELDYVERKESLTFLTERAPILFCGYRNAPDSKTAPTSSRVWKSICNHFNFFDPYREGNIPQQLADILLSTNNMEKTISLDAFASVTREGKGYAKVLEIFIAHLIYIKSKGKTQFSVIHQNLLTANNSRVKGGFEADRIHAILDLPNPKKFDGTYFAIVLSRNSGFYEQKGEYSELSNPTEFKQELFNQHFIHDPYTTGNYISSDLREKILGFEEEAENWVDYIHEYLFLNKESFSISERQVFYDVYQDLIVLKILIALGPDFFNLFCKDAIDRAADTVARLWVFLGVVNDVVKDEGFRLRYELFLFTRAMATKKRAIDRPRYLRNLQSVQWYETHSKQLKNLFYKCFDDVTILPKNRPPSSNNME